MRRCFRIQPIKQTNTQTKQGDKMTTIKTKYGYSVDCYGDCNEYAVLFMCFDDEIYDGHTESTFNNWRSAVLELSEYAHRNGTELVQLESDE
jgi:hypothetical protein